MKLQLLKHLPYQRLAVGSLALVGCVYCLYAISFMQGLSLFEFHQRWANQPQQTALELFFRSNHGHDHDHMKRRPPGDNSISSNKRSIEFRNASWQAEVGTWMSECATESAPPIIVTETFNRNTCANNCSGRGVCNLELSDCRCFHGFTGVACELEEHYECNLKALGPSDGPFGRWIQSMCSGTCDKRKAFCYCGEGTKYPNRPVAEQCGFAKIEGTAWKFDWNKRDLNVFSNDSSSAAYGWCNLDPSDVYARTKRKKKDCFCPYEGTAGELCEITTESTCINQCSGNGVCRTGFCACVEGWYGIDCSIPSPAASMKAWPTWLSDGIVHMDSSSSNARRESTKVAVERHRPLIYVYDLPAEFNSLLMEGRQFRLLCVNRIYDDLNLTVWTDQLYGAENALLESLLSSKHRTTNAEEADYFYVPVLGACATERAGLVPHMGTDEKYMRLRTYFAGDLYKQAYQHIRLNYPYWDRSDGRDHIWFFPWDEGACVSPKEIWNSMMLVHWGNTNSKYKNSTSQYPWDNWEKVPVQWRGNHPCYDPEKDLVLPAWKYPQPDLLPLKLWTRRQEERPILFYFRGNLGNMYANGRPEPDYSMGIRQRLAVEYASEPNLMGRLGHQSARDVKVCHARSANYSLELASSRFCGVLPGDGWSGRLEDSVLHGCIPVIVQDGVHLPFENVLDYREFSVRVAEDDLPKMISILRSIPDSKVDAMQSAAQRLWQRLLYHDAIRLEADRRGFFSKSQGRGVEPPTWAIEYARLEDDDAFTTFIQVLHYRLSKQWWRKGKTKRGRHGSNMDCRNYSYEK